MIVDASGSMAARLGTETRLDAARRVLLDRLAGWKPDTRLALVAYGHRRPSDCGDIETLVPLGRIDLARTKRRLGDLRARGMTPLSAALRHAAGLLPKDGGTIFLVSDGLETCKEDPCAVARSLRAANARLVIHVVGFGIPEDEKQALACIAAEGGGQMASAADAKALAAALTGLAAASGASTVPIPAPESPPAPPSKPVEPVPPPEPPPGPVPVAFHAVAAGTDALAGVPLGWSITADGAGEPMYRGGGEGISLELAPGRYRVDLTGANALGSAKVQVKRPGGPSTPVQIDIGRLDLSLVAGAGLKLTDVDLGQTLAWTITPLDRQRPPGAPTGATPTLALAPGRYRVAVGVDGHAAQTEVRVTGGGRSATELSLHLGRITLEAALGDQADPIAGGTELSWRLAPKGDGAVRTVDAVARPTLLVPAGDYTATLLVGGARLSADGTVQDGANSSIRVRLPAGKVTLEAALGPGAPAFDDWRDAQWTVTPVRLLGGVTAEPALSEHAAAQPAVTLLPGEWEALVVSGAARSSRAFVVAPGAQAKVRVDLAAGRLSVIATPAAGPAPLNVVISAYALAADGTHAAQPVFTGGTRSELAQILPAGRYRVTAEDETGRKATTDTDVVAGQAARIALELK